MCLMLFNIFLLHQHFDWKIFENATNNTLLNMTLWIEVELSSIIGKVILCVVCVVNELFYNTHTLWTLFFSFSVFFRFIFMKKLFYTL